MNACYKINVPDNFPALVVTEWRIMLRRVGVQKLIFHTPGAVIMLSRISRRTWSND